MWFSVLAMLYCALIAGWCLYCYGHEKGKESAFRTMAEIEAQRRKIQQTLYWQDEEARQQRTIESVMSMLRSEDKHRGIRWN